MDSQRVQRDVISLVAMHRGLEFEEHVQGFLWRSKIRGTFWGVPTIPTIGFQDCLLSFWSASFFKAFRRLPAAGQPRLGGRRHDVAKLWAYSSTL